MKTFRKFQVSISLVEIHSFMVWMNTNRMPFLAKMKQQRAWTRSAPAINLYSKMTNPAIKKDRTRRNGKERLIILQLKILQSDWELIRIYLRLAFPTTTPRSIPKNKN